MVLTFALCATVVFAQTQTASVRSQQLDQKAVKANALTEQKSQTPSFTKTVLATCDFSQENVGYTTGVVETGASAHGENFDFAVWQRHADASAATLQAMASTYNSLATAYFGGVDNFVEYLQRYLDTANTTTMNGWMMISSYDQRTANSGNFNAFIKFSGINTTSADIVDITLWQYYRKYYDYCYVDYSTNGTTWTSTEINVTGVDMGVNDVLNDFRTYTLPLAAAGQASIDVRIRFESLDTHRGSAYGYFWCVDDVTIEGGAADRLRYYDQEYTQGNYGMIPQNMEITPAWYCTALNNGANAQSAVTVTLNHLNGDQTTATEIGNYNNGNVAVGATTKLVCDAEGWFLLDSMEYVGWYGYIDHSTVHGTGSAMPTAVAGDNYIYAAVSNSALGSHSYDTMWYQAMTADENGNYAWGHDNGVLTYQAGNYWLFGYVNVSGTWYVTEDEEEVHFYQAGYMVNSRYTTGANVPEGWVIRGVELVASPIDNFHAVGTALSAVLYQDEYEGGSVGFQTVPTGAGVHEVAANEVNDSSNIGRNSNGYLTYGDYNTIRIMFPEQPALQPNTSYRIGYSIEEESYFALATEALGSYRLASPTRPDEYDTIIYFANNELTKKYASRFPVNQYQTYVSDPSYGGTGSGSTFGSWYVAYNPMIHMLVGPAQEITRYNIEINCEGEDYGEVAYGGAAVCGETITPAEGSQVAVTFHAFVGCEIAELVVDGETIDIEDNEHVQIAEGDEGDLYVYYVFENVRENHTISVKFQEGDTPIAIDAVAANVRMTLQPNPATSQVSLTIEGVNGMVNCTLVDMSGRVVYNQNINAENAKVIDLSNLAKGAYFVRITNNEFSKVKKLIVR